MIKTIKTKGKAKVDKTNEVEATVQISYTPCSNLKKLLQTWDDNYSKALKIHRIKFIENVGEK